MSNFLTIRYLLKYKNYVDGPNLLNMATENLSLKFLQFIWESTCVDAKSNKNNLSILKSLVIKRLSSSSNSLKNRKRKSILIRNIGNSSFNGGKHCFTISDLINKFVIKKNHKAIK